MENKNEKLRLFVAIEVPKNIRELLADFCESFAQKKLFSGNCTRSANFHLTLKFLGDVSLGIIPKIDEALQNLSFQKCGISLGHLDVLPTREKIRILFVELIAPELPLLAAAVEDALSFQFERKTRPFKSHVTVARIKSIQAHNYKKFLQEIDETVLSEEIWTIDSFVLKKSTLTQDGPIYEDLETYKLF